MKVRSLTPRTPALLAGVLTFSAAFASAQSAVVPEPATDLAAEKDGVVHLAQLDVTGENWTVATPVVGTTRLPLSLRETPQSVSVLDRLRLDLESIFSVDDAMRSVTGVYVSFYDTQRPLYFARGFQITDFQVDGIPTYSSSTNQEYDTALYERIDVIRGANGLISGAGMPSATVNLQRKRAQKVFGASLQATTGTWNYYRGEADVNVPLTTDGRFRGRIVLTAQSRDSFRDRYSEDKLAWLATLEGDLTATTTLAVGVQRQDNDPTSPVWGTLPRFAPDGSLAHLPRSISYSTKWTQWDRTSETWYATLDQQLGENWKLRALYNRTEGDVFSLRVYGTGFPDRTTGAGTYLRAGLGETNDVRDNLDLYLSGKFSLLEREHDLILGWNRNNLEARNPAFASVASWSYVIPNLHTWQGDAPIPVIAKTGARSVALTDQSGVFGSLRLRVTDALSTITGARLSQWETQTRNYNTSGAYTTTTGAYSVENELSPYIGAVYDLGKVWSAYASYTDIFRPQNYKDKDNNLLAPVLGTNLEAGLKAEFFAKRFQVSFGGFETKQDNYAVRDNTQPDNSLPDGSSAYLGVNGTQSRGFELELNGFIRAGWTANFGYSYVDTKRHALDLTYANVPEHLLRFSTHYQLPGAWNRLTIGGGVNWQSEQIGYGVTSPAGPVTVRQGSFALVNVFANYRINAHLHAALSVRNALDKTYWATLDYPNYGEPRALQVSLKWKH